MSEMTDDIDRWSEERLRLWLTDSMDRYQIVGLSRKQAFAYALSTLMLALARAVTFTDAPATEVGDRLVKAIDTLRKQRSPRKRSKS